MFMEVFQGKGVAWDRRWGFTLTDSSTMEESHKQVGCHKGSRGVEGTQTGSRPSQSARDFQGMKKCIQVCVVGVSIPEIRVSVHKVQKIEFLGMVIVRSL